MGGLAEAGDNTMVADPESMQDLAGVPISAADGNFQSVYSGEAIHRNEGRHLHERGGGCFEYKALDVALRHCTST